MSIKNITYLKILGKDYAVEWLSPHPTDEDILPLGKQDWNQGILYVQSKLDDDRALDTLIHEIIHALNCEIKIGDKGCELSEEAINRLAAGLQAVIRDNADTIRRAIIEELGGTLE